MTMFKNRIRLPFYVTRPQFPTEQNVFRLANGATKTASVVVKKTFEGETENLPPEIHERLVIALKHDNVTIEGFRYLGGVSLEDSYEIEWNRFLDYPLGKAEFKVQVTPFDYSNDNCKTCEEVTQIVCVDDGIGTVAEGSEQIVQVLLNDSICCSPVTLSIVTFNSTYVDSAVINANNTITINIKNPCPTVFNTAILRYRAECDNGSYDEANVIANINGTGNDCFAPQNLNLENLTDTTVDIIIEQPLGALSYEWQLYILSNLITPVQSGTATIIDNSVALTGLTPATQYRFYIRSVCDSGEYSDYAYVDFTTNPSSGSAACGNYELTNNSFGLKSVNYLDCNGNYQSLLIPSLQTRFICAMQSSPGNPVDITVQSGIALTYIDLC